MALAEQPCPLCGARNEETVCARRRDTFEFRCVRCRACGFYYVNPVPDGDTLSRFYDAAYVARHGETWHGLEDDLNRAVLRHLRRLGVGSLVDIGAGQGRFVHMARAAGIGASGVEANPVSVKEARDRYGLDLVTADADTFLASGNGSLECVTMLNVLEHIPQPMPVLRRIAARLRPGGVVLLVVPNVSFTLALGAVRRVLGFRDVYMLESTRFTQQGFDPPIHMCSFDAAHLRSAVVAAGLIPQRVTQAPVIGSARFLMRVAKQGVHAAGLALELGTAGRVVWGYSLLAVGRRPASPTR